MQGRGRCGGGRPTASTGNGRDRADLETLRAQTAEQLADLRGQVQRAEQRADAERAERLAGWQDRTKE
jgi:hypothetical protein